MGIKDGREYRSFTSFELQEEQNGSNVLILHGTPIVFDTPTCLYECDGVKYFEVIDRNALAGADMSDFIFNVNHGSSGRPVYARTKNGSLLHNQDGGKFNVEIHMDADDEGHRQLYRDIKSGRIDKMSFAFTVLEDSYDRDTHTRKILKIKKLYDVSAVDFPAYDDTDISARNFFDGEHRKEFEVLEQRRAREKAIAYTYLF